MREIIGKTTGFAFTLFHKIMKQKDGNIQPGCFAGVLSCFSYVKLKVAGLFLLVPS